MGFGRRQRWTETSARSASGCSSGGRNGHCRVAEDLGPSTVEHGVLDADARQLHEALCWNNYFTSVRRFLRARSGNQL